MSSQLFINFMQKRKLALIQKQRQTPGDRFAHLRNIPGAQSRNTISQPPGPPPRPGLVWKPTTHRWIRDPSSKAGEWENFYKPEDDDGWRSSQDLQRDDTKAVKAYNASLPKFRGAKEVREMVGRAFDEASDDIDDLITSGEAFEGIGDAKRLIEDKLPEKIIQQIAGDIGVTPGQVSAIVNDEVTKRAHEEVSYDQYDGETGDHYSNFLHD